MSRVKLTDYDISMKTGFVLEDPLTSLPPYFEPWNTASRNILPLIKEDRLREEIHKLPLLDFSRLDGDKEVKLAHSQLTILTSCYLWHKGLRPEDVPKVLPKCLAIPLYGLYEKYDIAPILTYADLFLNNCIIKDKSRPLDHDNLVPNLNIPGEDIWDWFFKIGVHSELTFAAVSPAMQTVHDGIDDMDEEKITQSLHQLADGVANFQKVNSLMKEKLPTTSFITKLAPTLSGYGDPPLLDGLLFEGVSNKPIKRSPPNAGQGPMFKFLDALLDIQHQKDRHEYTNDKFQYLQPKHRQFVCHVRDRPVRLRKIVESSSNTKMKEAFDKLVDNIVKFRSYHIQLVTKYIILGLNKTLPPTELEAAKPMKDFTVQYLKGMRDDTKVGKLPE